MNDGEDKLIDRARDGDADAFCLLAERYERRIYSLAFHYCHNRHDAEDLSQEVWLKVYQALPTFRGESTFYTWLRKITINCFLNYRRSRAFQSPGEMADKLFQIDSVEGGHQLPNPANSETTLHNRIMFERVTQALSELTAQQRLIFLLKHHEGMTYEEIAKAVGCSTGTAKKSVWRAIAKLRQHLDVKVPETDCVPCTAGQY